MIFAHGPFRLAPLWGRALSMVLAMILCAAGAASAREAETVRQDTNGDGKVDQVVHLDDRRRPLRLEVDRDGDGFFETVQHYRSGELDWLESDTDGDGRRETRVRYDQGIRVRVEMDTDGDGAVETAVDFRGERRLREWEDHNGDGHWDRIRTYLDPFWPLVEEGDEDGDGFFEERRSYAGGTLRERIIRDKATGDWTRVESYDAQGRLYMLTERKKGTDRGPWAIWIYDEDGRPLSFVQDRNGDGRADLWGDYDAGRLFRLAQDRNQDGRPDAWTEYNGAGAEARILRDVDGDGTVDIDKREIVK
ncbi:hypothetical protein [Desulfacinum hydrothermale]|nr:hypothetical protein [Desulfacinum hydrothermale]